MKVEPNAANGRNVFIFGFIASATILAAAMQWSGVHAMERVVDRTMRDDVELAGVAARLQEDVLQLRRYEKDVFINVAVPVDTAAYRAKWLAAFNNLRRDLLRAHAITPLDSSAALQAVADTVGAYRLGFDHTYDLVETGGISTPQQANDEIVRYKTYVHATESLIDGLKDLADQRMSSAQSTFHARRGSLDGWLLLLMGLTLTMAVLVHRSWRAQIAAQSAST
ncbi:MAG: hypothetical protein ACRET4_03045 [Steroidobacteraceae bacterium]